MALKLLTTIKGINQEWYIKAISVKADNKGGVLATYGYFFNVETAGTLQNSIANDYINFTAESNIDIFKQTYIELKKLDTFKSAIDC